MLQRISGSSFPSFRHLFVKYSVYFRRRELRGCNIESELASVAAMMISGTRNRLTRAYKIIFNPDISPINYFACILLIMNIIIERVQYSWLVLDDWSTARPRLTLLLFAQAGCDYGSRTLRELSSFAVPCRAHVVSYILLQPSLHCCRLHCWKFIVQQNKYLYNKNLYIYLLGVSWMNKNKTKN